MHASIPPPLTIGIDARAAAEVPAGRGRVVRELLRELAARDDDGHRYVLYARRPWEAGTLDERFAWHLLAAADPLWHVKAARAANRACDVFLSSNSYLTAWFLRIPCVPIIYDLTTFEPSMRPNRRSTVIERTTLGFAVRRAASFVAISQATADALASRFPAAAGRIAVAPLGVAGALGEPTRTKRAPAEALGKPAGAGAPAEPQIVGAHAAAPTAEELAALPAAGFVLAVGTLEPRKNLPRLVAAYRTLDDALQAHHPLVVVGARGWETGATLSALDSLGERCTKLGYVSDAALAELYRRCAVFCYPSLGEGFGLPVLEAMAAGAAVLTSNVSSLPEVGGEAVAYANPHDVGDIARGLEALLEDASLRARLSGLARARAAEFSWGRFAARTLETLEHAARW